MSIPSTQDLPLRQQPVWQNGWLAEQFVAWQNGGPEPANSLRDNIQCCALLFAAIESAHSRQPVDVQAFLTKHLNAYNRVTGGRVRGGRCGQFEGSATPMKKILFHTGGPRFHPVDEQATSIAGWLGENYHCEQQVGLAAFDALDESVDLLVIMGLHWPGMDDPEAKLSYAPMRGRDVDKLRKYVASGRPVLSHHGGILSYAEEPDFANACGWAWVWGETNHSPFGNWPVQLLPTGHPVIKDIPDYTLEDEIYYNVKVLEPDRVVVHAAAAFDGGMHPMVSTIDASSEHGRRLYFANGHDMKAFECDAVRKLWTNGVKWMFG